MRKENLIPGLIAVVLLLTNISHAAIVYTTPTSDGVATRNQWMGGKTTNFHTDGDIMGGYYYYYGGADRGFSYPVMQFPLAPFQGIDDTAELTATLGFHVTGGSNIHKAYVRFYDADGDGTITYNHGSSGAKVGENLAAAGWQSLDVTPQVITALNKGYSWITFNLAMPYYDMDVNVVSCEGAAGEYPGMGPHLSVAVPEPATLSLLGLGALPLLRRKKADAH